MRAERTMAAQAARSGALLFALLISAALLVSAACIPSASGQCSRDADCAGGPAGSFCADAICQGPTLATLVVPAGPFARGATFSVHVTFQRGHGGAAAASARLEANGARVAAVHDPDGSLRIDAPLSFAPAGQEGQAAFTVIASDDLGHETRLASSVLVDDEGPRIAVDPASVPTSANVRGAVVPLRVSLADEAASTLQFSLDGGATQSATKQADGTFRALIDTSRAAPAAASLDVLLLATDALGNVTQQHVTLPLTRLRWRSPATSSDQIVGMAIIGAKVLATTVGGLFIIVDRATGARTERALGTAGPSGNLVADETAAYTALDDGRVCKLGLDGSVRWCCDSIGTVSGLLALGPLPAPAAGAAPVPTVVALNVSNTGRFFALREGSSGVCDYQPSQTTAAFLDDSPAIGPDGLVYAAAGHAVAVGLFDGLAWTSQAFARSGNSVQQPAFSPASSSDDLGTRALLSGEFGDISALRFPAPSAAGMLPGTPSTVFSTQASPLNYAASTPAVLEDGTSVVATADLHLVAIAPDGSQRWSADLASAPSAAPVAGAGGEIYSAGSDGTLTAFALDGGVLWTFSAGARIVAPPSPGCDRAIYLGTSAGEILSISADSPGLANSPWPREGHDVRGTGDARRPMRDADGGCLE